jgi:hypothetical protein
VRELADVRHTLEPLAKFGVSGITKETDFKTPNVFDDLIFKTLETPNFASGSLVCRALRYARQSTNYRQPKVLAEAATHQGVSLPLCAKHP